MILEFLDICSLDIYLEYYGFFIALVVHQHHHVAIYLKHFVSKGLYTEGTAPDSTVYRSGHYFPRGDILTSASPTLGGPSPAPLRRPSGIGIHQMINCMCTLVLLSQTHTTLSILYHFHIRLSETSTQVITPTSFREMQALMHILFFFLIFLSI